MSTVKQRTRTEGKPQYPLMQSIKDTLKLKGTKRTNSEKKVSTLNDKSGSPIKSNSERRNGITRKVNGSKRLSAQRVALFKYNNVQVFNYVRNGSNSRKSSMSSLNSSGTVVMCNEYDSEVTNLKPQMLIGKGVLELYQIKTPAALDRKEQTMNYISLGRGGQIVHPILPKLKITKLRNENFKYLITFSNPERYWQIEFLQINGQLHDELLKITDEFESIISSVCIFIDENITKLASLKSNKTPPNNVNTLDQIKEKVQTATENDDDEAEELDYLLEDPIEQEPTSSFEYDVPTDLTEVFQRTMGRINSNGSRRYSSVPQFSHRRSMIRRSMSLFPEHEGRFS